MLRGHEAENLFASFESSPDQQVQHRYYTGESVDDSGIDGMSPVPVVFHTDQSQAKQIAKLVTKLIHDEGLTPESIAVLVSGYPKEHFYDLLKIETLPKPAMWSREEHFQKNIVLMDTMKVL